MADPLYRMMGPAPTEREMNALKKGRDPFVESDRPLPGTGGADAGVGTTNPNLNPADQALLEALLRAISPGGVQGAQGSGAFGGVAGTPTERERQMMLQQMGPPVR